MSENMPDAQVIIAILVGIVAVGAVVALVLIGPLSVNHAEASLLLSEETVVGSAVCRPVSDTCGVCWKGDGWQEICAS